MIVEIVDPHQKQKIAKNILEHLEQWFGLEESREEYIRKSQNLPFWAYMHQNKAVGFAVLGKTAPKTGELVVMGVLPDSHRLGVGKKLVQCVAQAARQQGCCFLQVKTVAQGNYPFYDKTVLFYRAMGFEDLEVFPTLWDAWNPCLVLVKYLGEK